MKKVKILYFEYDEKVARNFAEIVSDIYSEEVKGNVGEFLERQMVYWVKNRQEVQKKLELIQDFELFILNALHPSDNGLSIVRDIRSTTRYRWTPIWVYSKVAYFEKRTLRELKANEYFKTTNLQEIKAALHRWLDQGDDRWSPKKIQVVDRVYWADDIIMVQKDENGYSMYSIDRQRHGVLKTTYWERESIIAGVLKQVHNVGLTQFIKVNYKCLINVEWVVELSQKANGTYNIKMYEVDEKIIVSRKYAEMFEFLLGM